MTFLHPILLGVGGACVAIPIVIHLLMRRRRRPIPWAAMRFLLEAQRQRQRRVRLEQLLLLLTRCLLVALVATAVARPILGRGRDASSGPREMYILVDDSLTSASRDGEDAGDLERSVAQARKLLDGLDPARGDRAALITLASPARAVVSPPTGDLGVIERRLADLIPADSRMDLAGGLALIPPTPVGDDTEPAGVAVAVCSAFRAGSLGRTEPLGPLPTGASISATAPADTPLANTAIASFELLRPVVVAGESDPITGLSQARATLTRSGSGLDADALTTLRVTTDQTGAVRKLGDAVVRWTPGQREAQTTIDLDLSDTGLTGRTVLRAEIDRDANDRDNVARAVLDVRERLRVAILGTRRFGARPRIEDFGPSDWLRLALEPVDTDTRSHAAHLETEVLDATRLDPGALAGFDAALVAEPGRVRQEGWAALGEFHDRGGAVLLTASPTPGAQLWPELARSALGLPWEFDRDPTDIPPDGPADARTLAAPPVDARDPLWFIRAELPALAQTVTVERLLGVAPGDDARVLLRTGSGLPVLLTTAPDDRSPRAGPVALLTAAVDLAWTDLPARPLMVPLVQELVRSGIGARGARAALAGSRLPTPAGAVEVLDRAAAEPRALPVDPATGQTRNAVRLAGAYVARDTSGQDLGVVIVQPDTLASDTTPGAADRVGAWLGASGPFAWSDGPPAPETGAEAPMETKPAGPGPGLPLLLAVLALACAELALARVVSHASRAGGGP